MRAATHSHWRRAVSLATSAALVAQVAACGTAPPEPDQSAQLPQSVSLLIASPYGDKLALKTVAGFTWIDVTTTWSAQPNDTVPLTVHAPADGEFVIFSYEIGKGLAPAKVALAPPPAPRLPQNGFAKAGMEGVMQGLLPWLLITAPIWLPIAGLASRAEARRIVAAVESGPCCFVWIEDAKSGEVVAGRPPWEHAKLLEQGAATPATPEVEGEDLVNCTVAGNRRWVYRSQCDA